MKKKLICLTVFVLLVFTIVGCGKEKLDCKHDNIAIDEAVFPTCTENGLTRGSHCSDCGLVLEEQQELSLVDHLYEEKLVSDENGSAYYAYFCKMCGYEAEERYSAGLSIEPDHENRTCTVTGMGTCSDSDLIIRSQISGYTVTGIGYAAFRNLTELKSVTIPDGVTHIECDAFSGCSNLTVVTLPDSITRIDSGAFAGCKSLGEVRFEGDLEAWCNIFVEGETVTPLGNGADLYINGVLLENLVIPDTVEKVPNNAFSGCGSLKSITVPGSVQSIGTRAFWGCTAVEKVTISDGVQELGWDTFADCTALKEITIPDSVYSINDFTFSGCSALTKVTLGESVSHIGDRAFEDCTALVSITIPAALRTTGSSAFANCTALKDVYYTGDLTSWCEIHFDPFSNPLCNGAELYINSVPLEDAEIRLESEFITYIMEYTFFGCESLKSVTICDGVTGIGLFAFNSCKNLESITIPQSIQKIDFYAFEGCESLETVYFCGTEEEWENISLLSAGTELTSAARFYYSETSPDGTGYWHYVDGVPTLW